MERGVQIQAGTPLELGDIVENMRQSQMSIPMMSSVSLFHKPIIQIRGKMSIEILSIFRIILKITIKQAACIVMVIGSVRRISICL